MLTPAHNKPKGRRAAGHVAPTRPALRDLTLRQLGRASWTWFTQLPAWHPVVITLCLVPLYVATHMDVTATSTGGTVILRSIV